MKITVSSFFFLVLLALSLSVVAARSLDNQQMVLISRPLLITKRLWQPRSSRISNPTCSPPPKRSNPFGREPCF